MPSPPDTLADVCVIGAGFAGAATAAALTSRGVRSVVVVDAEPIPGRHGSGRNAAMARRIIGDPVLTRLAVDSVARIGALQQAVGRPLLDRVGGLLVGSDADISALEAIAREVPELASETRRLDRRDLAARVPVLSRCAAETGLFSPGCGVVDIHALLTSLVDGARAGGAEVRLNARVTAIEVHGGRVRGVQTTRGRVACDVVVDAAGFGALEVARLAGAAQPPLDPVRRHLFVTAPLPAVDRRWPFVWDVTHGVYFRPEGDGLLLCACDETSWPPEEPPTDPGVRELLAEKFSCLVPELADVRPARGWAGLRVMTPDGRFVVGPDPAVEGFYWVAGLGGHGMTTSLGVGALAADELTGAGRPAPYDAALSPARFGPKA